MIRRRRVEMLPALLKSLDAMAGDAGAAREILELAHAHPRLSRLLHACALELARATQRASAEPDALPTVDRMPPRPPAASGLTVALGALGRTRRHQVTVGLAAIRNAAAERGDMRLAAVWAELAALVAEATDAEDAALRAAEADLEDDAA